MLKVAPVLGATLAQRLSGGINPARMAYDKKDVVMEGVRGSPRYL